MLILIILIMLILIMLILIMLILIMLIFIMILILMLFLILILLGIGVLVVDFGVESGFVGIGMRREIMLFLFLILLGIGVLVVDFGVESGFVGSVGIGRKTGAVVDLNQMFLIAGLGSGPFGRGASVGGTAVPGEDSTDFSSGLNASGCAVIIFGGVLGPNKVLVAVG